MATNQEKRQALGNANQDARRNLGQANQDARRAGGSDMIERRTGKKQVDDLNSFLNLPRQKRSQRTVEPRGSLPAQRGTGTYTAPPASTGGGGIASPLTVKQIQYSEEPTYVPTFDASGYFAVKKIAGMLMVDAEGREIVVAGFDKIDENGNLITEVPDGG